MIKTIYHVEVKILQKVWDKWGQTAEFSRMSMEATAGSLTAGTEWYYKPYEYATFDTLKKAQLAEAKLKEMVLYFKTKKGSGTPLPFNPGKYKDPWRSLYG